MKKLLLLAAMASLACGASAQEEATLYPKIRNYHSIHD